MSEPHPPSRTQTIAHVLRDEILSGRFRPGERLPSERDLSERFTVSRGAVREAFKQLQELGIASIQPGGARVVPIEACTLGVLGPLLDLTDIPEPKLVDEVLEMLGVLMREAATQAIEKATDEELDEARRIVDKILSRSADGARQFEAVRELGEFYVAVADNLVLRLIVNGLRTSFMARMASVDPNPKLEPIALAEPIRRIRRALAARDAEELSSAMHDLNCLFRNRARAVLKEATRTHARKGA